MIPVAQKSCVPIVLMHMRGLPQTMTQSVYSTYDDVTTDISNELNTQLARSTQAVGLPRWMQIVDPGFGFAKSVEDSRSLMQPGNFLKFRENMQHRPVMVGLSRKRFLEHILLGSSSYQSRSILSVPPSDRDYATVAGCLAALATINTCADDGPILLRVHNVKAAYDACTIFSNLFHSGRRIVV
jgi:dihydropteroate synthase